MDPFDWDAFDDQWSTFRDAWDRGEVDTSRPEPEETRLRRRIRDPYKPPEDPNKYQTLWGAMFVIGSLGWVCTAIYYASFFGLLWWAFTVCSLWKVKVSSECRNNPLPPSAFFEGPQQSQ